MRHRTMACVLVLTIGDYLLWDWSLVGSHDILSLVAGLTLLPLAAATFGLLALATLHLLARVARASSRMARSMRAPQHIAAVEQAAVEQPAPRRTADTAAASSQSQSSSGRLAA